MKSCVALLMLLFTGCQVNSSPGHLKSDDIRYFKDERTGLSFAAINSPNGHLQVYGRLVIQEKPGTVKIKDGKKDFAK